MTRTRIAIAWFLPAALLAGAAAWGADGPASTPLAPIRSEVAARLDAGGLTHKVKRTLSRAARKLAPERSSVAAELRALGAVSRPLERALPADATFAQLLDDALGELRARTLAEREDLAGWAGQLPDPRDEDRLTHKLVRFDLRVAAADAAERRTPRARKLARACRVIDRFARRHGLELPAPAPGAVPAFRLEDLNPDSPTAGRDVSPRDLQGLVSAWYFGHAT